MSNLNNLILKNIDLKNGLATYNDFEIDPRFSFKKQEWSFKEDLLQICYGEIFTVDIGWYPEFNSTGFFLIRVIKNYD